MFLLIFLNLKFPNRYLLSIKDEIIVIPHYQFNHIKWGSRYSKQLFNLMKNTSKINFKSLKNLIEKNYPPALHIYGELYEFGIGNFEKNLTLAFEYYNKAAKLGYIESYSSLAFFYRYGIGINKTDLVLSEIYSTLGSESKSIRSMLYIATSNTFGINRPRSLRNAATLLTQIASGVCKSIDNNKEKEIELKRLSKDFIINPIKEEEDNKKFEFIQYKANLGDKEALIDLGIINYQGQFNQPINYQEALKIFLENQDNPRTFGFLARMNHFGHGLEKNLIKAREFYEKAIENGDINAKAGYGILLMDEDIDQSIEYLKQASNEGHIGATFNLASLSLSNKFNKEKNISQAYIEFKKLLHEGFSMATLNIAIMLLNGQHKFNEKRALKYLWRIMRKGPWNNLGKIAEESFLKGNYETSLQIWMELGDIGIERAAFNSGLMLLNWEKFWKIPPLNLNNLSVLLISKKMFKISYWMGYIESSNYLSNCYFKLNKTDKAIYWLKKELNNAYSTFSIADLTLNGKLVKRNYTEIFELINLTYKIKKSSIIVIILFYFKIIFYYLINLFNNNLTKNDFKYFLNIFKIYKINIFKILILFYLIKLLLFYRINLIL